MAMTKKGFSLIELIVGIVLLAMVTGILVTLTLGGVKNGKFTQTLGDLTILTSQKATQLFSEMAVHIKSMPVNTNYVGSIDPNELISSYTDYLNESGCVIKTLKTPKFGEGNPTPTKGRLGDIGNGDSDGGNGETNLNPLDCSKSPFTNNSSSLVPRFRRQWIIVKNKPSAGDATVGVILVDQSNNSIVRSETLVKVDGSSKQ